jgi:tripartite-type tricarboxylate transporter receptor subunit TctC
MVRTNVAAACIGVLMSLPGAASAQDFPTRPLTLVVPFVAGGGIDVTARIQGQRMGELLGQTIVIENIGAAAGMAGGARVARAAPDGYTFEIGNVGTHAYNQTLYKKPLYNAVTDFTPIGLATESPRILVTRKDLPVNNLQELIAYAKARPGQLNYGSVGVGSSQHLAGEYFSQVTGVKITHVPYRNIGQYVPDLIAGSVPLGFQWYPNVSTAIEARGAKALAVAGTNRLEASPETPTSKEAGLPEYVVSGWFALLAPKRTPAAIVTKLNSEVISALADCDVRAKFQLQGAEPVSLSPEQAKKFVSEEIKKYHDIIVKSGMPQIE